MFCDEKISLIKRSGVVIGILLFFLLMASCAIVHLQKNSLSKTDHILIVGNFENKAIFFESDGPGEIHRELPNLNFNQFVVNKTYSILESKGYHKLSVVSQTLNLPVRIRIGERGERLSLPYLNKLKVLVKNQKEPVDFVVMALPVSITGINPLVLNGYGAYRSDSLLWGYASFVFGLYSGYLIDMHTDRIVDYTMSDFQVKASKGYKQDGPYGPHDAESFSILENDLKMQYSQLIEKALSKF